MEEPAPAPAPGVDGLEEENTRLQEALRVLQERYDRLDASTAQKIQELTDEVELLAEANRLLMDKQEEMEAAVATTATEDPMQMMQVPDELLLPGPAVQMQEAAAMDEVHAFGNLLCVSAHASRPELVITGGVDKQICAHDWKLNRTLCAAQCSAPVLALAFNPRPEFANFFVAASMDAKHALYRLKAGEDATWEMHRVCDFHDHTRQGTLKVAWSASGTLFATGSSDKSVNIYRCANLNIEGSEQCEKIKSFYFNGTVEAIVFVPTLSTSSNDEASAELEGKENSAELLVVAVRDDCYVHYVDCMSFEKERVNMNQDGIEHVSYNIMDLRLSPCGKYLLAATDASRHFIFAIKRNVPLRNFYGHKAGPYSQPRVAWHPSEKYVLSNTEDNGTVFIWSVASERVVETVDAHDALVRDLECPPAAEFPVEPPRLATVSYDKRLKLWDLPVVKSGVEF